MYKVFGYDSNIHKCVPCINAKRLLDAKKKDYEFVSVVTGKDENGPVFDDAVIAQLLAKLGRETQIGLTMPQVFAPDGTHIGGFDQLKASFK